MSFYFFFVDFVTDLLWRIVLLSICCSVWIYCLGMAMSDSDGKTYSIKQRHQIMVVNTLQNSNHRYSSHYMIIKYVVLEPILYAINLDVTTSAKVLKNLNICFY